MEQVREWADKVTARVAAVFYGKDEKIRLLLIALLCRGHVLIEDVPGVGKTVLARATARAVGGKYGQIQCTPDLLPADVLGVSVYNQKTGEFVFRNGPVMTNLLLVDEINRATPRTQSALLEAMAEGQVSVEGRSIELPRPFFLIATQGLSESDGTFALPEVQKDRFFLSFSLGYPNREAEDRIMAIPNEDARPVDAVTAVSDEADVVRMQETILSVHVEESIKDYIMQLVEATRSDERLQIGVSPRGSLALYRGAQAAAALNGRDYVVPEDVKSLAGPILNQRLLLRSDLAARGLTAGSYIDELLRRIESPGYEEVG